MFNTRKDSSRNRLGTASRRLQMESLESRRLFATFQGVDLGIDESLAPETEVVFRLEATDAQNSPIAQVAPGEDFSVNIYAQDTRDEAIGIWGAYLDLAYDETLVTSDGSINLGSEFANGQSGSHSAGLFDEVGGFGGFDPQGGGEFLLATLTFHATAEGVVEFSANPADVLPDHHVLLHGESGATAEENIDFGSISILVQASPPVAESDALLGLEDTPTTFTPEILLGNDSDPRGSDLRVELTEQPTHGSLVVSEDGNFVYTPKLNFNGSDSFAYQAVNEQGTASNVTTATIDVLAVNDTPIAGDDVFEVGQDRDLVISLESGVLSNDVDPDSQSETDQLRVKTATQPENGRVTISEDGSFVYSPVTGFSGTDSFTYVATDGLLESSATVTIDVIAPIVQYDVRYTDLDGNPLTSVSVGQEFFAEVTVQNTGEQGNGVYAAYVDANYTTDSASVVGEIEHGSQYNSVTSGSTQTPGELDEAGGAFTDWTTPGGRSLYQLFRIRMRAEELGTVEFSLNPTEHYMAETLVFDLTPLNGLDIAYGSASIDVVPSWHNPLNPLDVNSDGRVAPLDALHVINRLNETGAGELPTTRGDNDKMIDVNNDGRVSPLDALLVINQLNSNSIETVGEGEALVESSQTGPFGQVESSVDEGRTADELSPTNRISSLDLNEADEFLAWGTTNDLGVQGLRQQSNGVDDADDDQYGDLSQWNNDVDSVFAAWSV